MTEKDDLVVTTYAERPEYVPRVYDMDDAWPRFMGHDKVANALLWRVVETFPQLCSVATLDGRPVARARAAPFAQHAQGRDGTLPDGGWDTVMMWAFDDHADGVPTDTVTALEVAIDPAHQGRGLSTRMLGAMRQAATAAGFRELVAPVRPNEKHREPHTPTAEYAARTRPDGLPADAWLRVHVRAGATIESVAPTSMTIAGSLAEWRDWTGLPFATSGPVEVPEALVPVHCDLEQDHAVYVEPNVWVRHRLR